MTRYIQWGERRGTPSGATHYGFGGNAEVDPTDLSTVQALWSALPPDLRLALAKTAPKVVWNWEVGSRIAASRRCNAGGQPAIIWRKGPLFEATVHRIVLGCFPTLAEAQAACDAALLAQGYVLDGDAP